MSIKLFTTPEEWDAWYRLTPQQRFAKSAEFLQQYLAMGGSLDPDYDPQSPFNNDYYPDGPPTEQIDQDFALLASLCADSDSADEERLKQAIHEAREQAKEQVRRQMGLS